MLAVFLREVHRFFMTPLGYVFMALFLFLSGLFFSLGNIITGSSDFNRFLASILSVYLFSVPLLTMRLIAEERRQGTDQLLLASPNALSMIVFGKFLAAMLVFVLTLLLTVAYATLIAIYGDLAVRETLGAYLGFLFLGASFIAVGLFVSALSQNQVSAAFLTFVALLLFWMADGAIQYIPRSEILGIVLCVCLVGCVSTILYINTKSRSIAGLTLAVGLALIGAQGIANTDAFANLTPAGLSWFSLVGRFESFALGIIKLEDVVYYVSFVFVFLFLTVHVLERRRWA
jgi:ABC-2 type transport system permease protein